MSHAATSIEERTAGFELLRQEVAGRKPKGCFEFSDDLEFTDEPSDDDPTVVQVLKTAISRDARHCSAGPLFLRRMGYSQALRSIYEGGKKLIEGGVK